MDKEIKMVNRRRNVWMMQGEPALQGMRFTWTFLLHAAPQAVLSTLQPHSATGLLLPNVTPCENFQNRV